MLFWGFLLYLFCSWRSIWYFNINVFWNDIRFCALFFEEILALKLSNLVNKTNLIHNFSQDVYFFFSTCFGRLCVRHQKKQLYLFDTWYMLFCMDDWNIPVVSADDGHIVARNMQRKEINILRTIVHPVGFIYKIIQGWTVNKT